MKNGIIALVMGLAAALILAIPLDAEAKRLGGGKSFGSKQSHSQNYTPAQSSRPDQVQGAAAPAAGAGTAAAAGAGAKTGMMGGMLGGLLMGGLLGALFFGGAFENINFMDILIFAVLAFVLFKVFTMMRRQSNGTAPAAAGGAPYAREDITARQAPASAPLPGSSSRGFDTDIFNDAKRNETVQNITDTVATGGRPVPGHIVASFDQTGFVDGAKNAFARLQQAWNEGDMADIRQFTTDKVFGEVQDQYHARTADSRTEIVDLNAMLIEASEVNGYHEAAVYFEAQLREADSNSEEDVEVTTAREVWHFVRPVNSRVPTWFLDGIQQVS